MIHQVSHIRLTILAAFTVSLIAVTVPAAGQDPSKTRFEVVVPETINANALTGRAYVMIARTDSREPRLQIGRTGEPFFGRDFEGLPGGAATIIDGTDLGWPVERLADLPDGEYYVQGFVNVYSEFNRADDFTVWMHDDQWEGQHFNRSPGNLYSDVQRIRLDASEGYSIRLVADNEGYSIRLVADNVIPAVEIPANTEWVERFRFESPTLTAFWGRPIYLGATVLLPKEYHDETIEYPVLYRQGHFSLAEPLGGQVREAWVEDDFPRLLVVTFQHPTPYFDDSYAVNSVNVGPYGDAILEELIPEIERRYRIIKQPWARLDGGRRGIAGDYHPGARPGDGSRWRFRSTIRTSSAGLGPTARIRSRSRMSRV